MSLIVAAFDPGKSSGYAIFEDAVIKDMGILVGFAKLGDFLETDELIQKANVFVIENFRIRPGVNHSWSEVPATKAIGVIEAKAMRLKTKIIRQEPSILPIAVKWSHVDHNALPHDKSHSAAAYNHGVYFLIKNKLMEHPLAAKG